MHIPSRMPRWTQSSPKGRYFDSYARTSLSGTTKRSSVALQGDSLRKNASAQQCHRLVSQQVRLPSCERLGALRQLGCTECGNGGVDGAMWLFSFGGFDPVWFRVDRGHETEVVRTGIFAAKASKGDALTLKRIMLTHFRTLRLCRSGRAVAHTDARCNVDSISVTTIPRTKRVWCLIVGEKDHAGMYYAFS